MTEMTVERARTLAADLIGQLAENVGDPDAVTATLARWCDVLGPGPFGLVCMAAMQTTFTDWLHGVPAAEFPPGGVTLAAPRRSA